MSKTAQHLAEQLVQESNFQSTQEILNYIISLLGSTIEEILDAEIDMQLAMTRISNVLMQPKIQVQLSQWYVNSYSENGT